MASGTSGFADEPSNHRLARPSANVEPSGNAQPPDSSNSNPDSSQLIDPELFQGALPSDSRQPINLHAARFGAVPGDSVPLGNVPTSNLQVPPTFVPVNGIPMNGIVPMNNIPMTNVPMTNVPMTNMPMTNMPMNNMPMNNIPIGNMPMSNVPMNSVPIVDINSPIRVLARYQIELIVDHSLSMRSRDCPGGLSRWDWCGVQAMDLSRAISPFVPDGLTITPFANNFQVYPRSSPFDIANLFQNPQFHFGTRLAEPLRDRLKYFFAHRDQNTKPLLIAVITDGVPFPQPEPMMVLHELVGASKAMRDPNEVTVVFFQIGGHDRFGHEYLQFLDQKLVRNGARFHYVHNIPFEQLMAVGLARALVDTVQAYSMNSR